MATRFFEEKKNIRGTIKCLYHEGNLKDSLLCMLLGHFPEIDRYIIVGGYEFELLQNTLEREECFEAFRNRMVIVNNKHFREYGSGYSLYKGLQEALKYDFEEIIFAEGDLYIDRESCKRIYEANKNVLTINTHPILANQSVALYLDLHGGVHYIYDIMHGALEINEPFTAILNSGQVWKFASADITAKAFEKLTDLQWQGTNLVFIEEYFSVLQKEDYEIVCFDEWMNCNTISDFREIKKRKESYEANQ